MTQDDEKYCLKELSRGNQQAFQWLFMDWHPRLVDFFTHLLGDGDLAYDYAQDVFFDIWKTREKFSKVESFSSYLFQMAKFKVYNHFDKTAVKEKFKKEMALSESGSISSKESDLYASEMETIIWDTVRHLPSKRRKAFVMSRMHGYTNEQIADEMGISKRTVENHITSTLSALRKVIKN